MRGGAEEVADAQRYPVREVSRGGGIRFIRCTEVFPRGRYQTRGGEVSDARRYPAGKVLKGPGWLLNE